MTNLEGSFPGGVSFSWLTGKNLIHLKYNKNPHLAYNSRDIYHWAQNQTIDIFISTAYQTFLNCILQSMYHLMFWLFWPWKCLLGNTSTAVLSIEIVLKNVKLWKNLNAPSHSWYESLEKKLLNNNSHLASPSLSWPSLALTPDISDCPPSVLIRSSRISE